MMETHEYEPPAKSARRIAADDAAKSIRSMGLTRNGSLVMELEPSSNKGRYYGLSFNTPGGSGFMAVFRTSQIRVSYHTDLPGMPARDSRTFGSVEEALAFLRFAFVERRTRDALTIPVARRRRDNG